MSQTTRIVAVLFAVGVVFAPLLSAENHGVPSLESPLDPCCQLVKVLAKYKVLKFDIQLRKSIPSTFDESSWKNYKRLFQGTSFDTLYPFNSPEGLYSERRLYLSADSTRYLSIGVVEFGNGGVDFAIVVALIEFQKVSCAYCAADYSDSNDGEYYLSSRIERGKIVWSLRVPSIRALRAYGELLNPVCEPSP